jgi:hypothetical protein
MESKRKLEDAHESSFQDPPFKSSAKSKKREKLDKLVQEASLRVSDMILDVQHKPIQGHPEQRLAAPTLVSASIKIPRNLLENGEEVEPRWAKYVRKECNVQFLFRRRKNSPIGEIILTGLKTSVEQADYLTRMLLQTVGGEILGIVYCIV